MTATTLERLVKYPHAAVFDKAPGAELAFRLRHPEGSSWRIADGSLSVTVGDVTWDYDLGQHTVASLAHTLEADGFEVLAVSSEFASRGAAVLIEGAGDQSKSNGDHVYAHTSILWTLMGGYAGEIREAEHQVHEALRQMVITQAEGEWLDLWGMLYAVDRLAGESDADYAKRIPSEAFRIRVNGLAIEKAVKELTGKDVELREPWREMFTLDESSLSGSHRFPDEKYYGYFLIQPIAREAFDWTDVLEVIHRNRAAGIEVYPPAIEFSAKHLVASDEYDVHVGREDTRPSVAYISGENPLGVMRLSDNDIVLNHPMAMLQMHGISSSDGLAMQDASEKIIKPRSIIKAAITLSDGVPLGDENAIFPRGLESVSFDPPSSLSDELELSEQIVVRDVEYVEAITLQEHQRAIEYPFHLASVSLLISEEESHRASAQWIPEILEMDMIMTEEVAGQDLGIDFFLDVSILD